MSRFNWLAEYLARLEEQRVSVRSGDAACLSPAHCLFLDAEDWGKAARVAAESGFRWAGIWGDPVAEGIVIRAALVQGGGLPGTRDRGAAEKSANRLPYTPFPGRQSHGTTPSGSARYRFPGSS